MRKFIFSFLIIFSIYGCEKNYVIISPTITGKWSWISTCGGIYPECTTPESTGQKINIVFTADSVYKFYKNDTLTESVRFHTAELKGFQPYGDMPFTTYSIKWDSGLHGVFSVTDGILTIWDGNYDGFTSQYKRIK